MIRHDFAGRSAGRGAFQLWTHHLKDITYNATFVPKGAPESETYEGKSVTICSFDSNIPAFSNDSRSRSPVVRSI
jgi:hypothetical protein